VLKDPQGAVFAVIDPENARPESVGIPPLGSFSWHELATSDNEAGFAFYSGLFGWDAMERMDMGATGIYLVFGMNGVQRGGIYIKPPDWPAPPNWMPYGQVRNVDESCAPAESAGAKILAQPMDVPGGSRIASFIDPAGAPFAIHSFPAATPALKPKPASKPVAKVKAKVKVKTKAKAKAKPKKAKAKVAKKVVKKAKRKSAPVKRKAARSKAKKSKTVRRKK
jgi:predicted enzyme related to lactoylglutathione lyase